MLLGSIFRVLKNGLCQEHLTAGVVHRKILAGLLIHVLEPF
jgi:hypothetical protein